jgi:hypothetical protein
MSRRVAWRKVLAWLGLTVAAVVVLAVVVYVVFWPLSDVIARHDVGSITGPHRAVALQAARDAARGRLIALGAGLFAAAALVYTARNFSLTRQGQMTDRYTRAIEQLGSGKEIDVRIGGIYALERIAHDSPRDHPTIMEVLAAFIRRISWEQWPPAEPGAASTRSDVYAPSTRPDVYAAVTVIGRRIVRNDTQPINLFGAKIHGADLTSPDLTRVGLHRVDLAEADLTGANLTEADLTGADLTGASLTRANLTRANLTRANLTRANLTRADLTRADLTGADLTGAILTDAFLPDAGITDVRWPSDRPVPSGWQRDTHSGRLKRAARESGHAAPE